MQFAHAESGGRSFVGLRPRFPRRRNSMTRNCFPKCAGADRSFPCGRTVAIPACLPGQCFLHRRGEWRCVEDTDTGNHGSQL